MGRSMICSKGEMVLCGKGYLGKVMEWRASGDGDVQRERT